MLKGIDFIRRKAKARWDSQGALRAYLGDPEALSFPWSIALGQPTATELLEHFDAIRATASVLAKRSGSPGYRLELRSVNSRSVGKQELPVRAVFDTPRSLIAFLGHSRRAERCADLLAFIASEAPELANWARRHPFRVLEHEEDWAKNIAIVDAFRSRKCVGRYLRELAIPRVHTKFIESHRSLLHELFVAADIPCADADVRVSQPHGFERRYGLRIPNALVRLRWLGPSASPWGFDELAITGEAFANLPTPCHRVLIVENEISALSLPRLRSEMMDTLVLWGSGYRVLGRRHAGWLRDVELLYWGDIDTHGFRILSRLRGIFPHVRSILMDEATFTSHRWAWGHETRSQRFLDPLEHLSVPETALFDRLRGDYFAKALRLEQEHVAMGAVSEAIHSESSASPRD